MLKLLKSLSFVLCISLLTSGCVFSSGENKPTKETPPVASKTRYSNGVRYPGLKKKGRTFNTPRNLKGKSFVSEPSLADLRGVVSEDAYSKIDETETANPINGYDEVEESSLSENTPDKQIPVKVVEKQKVVLKTKPASKPSLQKIDQASLLGLSEDKALKLLKSPNNIYKSKIMSLWDYKNNTCEAKLYFYEGSCSYIETSFNKAGFNDADACLNTFGL